MFANTLLPRTGMTLPLLASVLLFSTSPNAFAQQADSVEKVISSAKIEKMITSAKFIANAIAPYEFKCDTNAINIPPGSRNLTFKFQFEKKVNGKWEHTGPTITVTTGTHKGSAQADTGWFPIVPAKGENWRAKMECHYIDKNNVKMTIPVLFSNALTPKP